MRWERRSGLKSTAPRKIQLYARRAELSELLDEAGSGVAGLKMGEKGEVANVSRGTPGAGACRAGPTNLDSTASLPSLPPGTGSLPTPLPSLKAIGEPGLNVSRCSFHSWDI